MVTPIQVIAAVFGLFALSRVFLRLKDGNLTRREFIFWTVIWIGMLFFAFFPNTITDVGMRLGIERGMNLIAALSIIVLFYLVFRIYVKLESQNQELTKIVRALALEKRTGKKKPGKD